MTDEMREAVARALENCHPLHGEDPNHMAINVMNTLAPYLRAMRNEVREECAATAESDVDWPRFGKTEITQPWENGHDDARDYRVGIVSGRSIAAAIRAMKEPEE